MPRTHFSVYIYDKVVDHLPEYADADNPTGAIYRMGYGIEAQTECGNVYRYTGDVEHLGHANAIEAICERQAKRGDLNVEDSDEWQFTRYAYGSDAYVDNYAEAEVSMMDHEEIEFHKINGTLPI
jgi:hypothetical protein